MVPSSARKLLQNRLLDFHKELANEVAVDSMVTCPNILLEFNSFHNNQIIYNNHFTVKDVTEIVEKWSHQYAVVIIQTMNDIFSDIDRCS